MMVYCLRRQADPMLALILFPQIAQILLDVNACDFLQNHSLKVRLQGFQQRPVKRYCSWLSVASFDLQREPHRINEADKIICFWLRIRRGRSSRSFFLLAFGFYLSLPLPRLALRSLSCLCWGQCFRWFPSHCFLDQFSFWSSPQVDRKPIGSNLFALPVFFDARHFHAFLPVITKAFRRNFAKICAHFVHTFRYFGFSAQR